MTQDSSWDQMLLTMISSHVVVVEVMVVEGMVVMVMVVGVVVEVVMEVVLVVVIVVEMVVVMEKVVVVEVVEAVTVVEVIKAVMVVEGTVVEVELPALDESHETTPQCPGSGLLTGELRAQDLHRAPNSSEADQGTASTPH
ncbi:unnamed protein product [Gadus morhua 'NCC']